MTEKCKHSIFTMSARGLHCDDCHAALELVEKGALAAAEAKACNIVASDYVCGTVKTLKEQLATAEKRSNRLARINEEVNTEIEVVEANERSMAVDLTRAQANACHGEDHCEALLKAREDMATLDSERTADRLAAACYLGESVESAVNRLKTLYGTRANQQAANIRTMGERIEELEKDAGTLHLKCDNVTVTTELAEATALPVHTYPETCAMLVEVQEENERLKVDAVERTKLERKLKAQISRARCAVLDELK